MVARAAARAKEGDREAVRYLYLRYSDNVYGYVRSIVRDDHEAEDVTQHVFAKVMTVIGKYDPTVAPFRVWVAAPRAQRGDRPSAQAPRHPDRGGLRQRRAWRRGIHRALAVPARRAGHAARGAADRRRAPSRHRPHAAGDRGEHGPQRELGPRPAPPRPPRAPGAARRDGVGPPDARARASQHERDRHDNRAGPAPAARQRGPGAGRRAARRGRRSRGDRRLHHGRGARGASRRSSPARSAPRTPSASPPGPRRSSSRCARWASAPATRSSCRPTRSSRPPRPSALAGATPCLVDVDRAHAPADRRDRGRAHHAATALRHPGPPVRIDGRPRPAHGGRPRRRHRRDRGRRARRTAPATRAVASARSATPAASASIPTKNLGAWGDGGAVVTPARGLADRVRLLRSHGERPRYHHRIVGTTARLDALQAAILRVKLRRLEGWNAASP